MRHHPDLFAIQALTIAVALSVITISAALLIDIGTL